MSTPTKETTLAKFNRFASHYVYGLVASCWNAAVDSVYVGLGAGAAIVAGQTQIEPGTIGKLWPIVFGTVVVHAVEYFHSHPMPADYTGDATVDAAAKLAAAPVLSGSLAPKVEAAAAVAAEQSAPHVATVVVAPEIAAGFHPIPTPPPVP